MLCTEKKNHKTNAVKERKEKDSPRSSLATSLTIRFCREMTVERWSWTQTQNYINSKSNRITENILHIYTQHIWTKVSFWNVKLTNDAKTYFWSFSWRKTNTSDRSMAWTSAKTKKQRIYTTFFSLSVYKCMLYIYIGWRVETFESSGWVFQLQCSVMQQLPPSDQVLFSKHLTTLHPHDGLTVSATEDHTKQNPCLQFSHLALVQTELHIQ